jgi:DNA topoisomerase-1
VAAAKSGDADEEAPTGPEKSAARAKSSAKKSGARKPAANKPAAKKTAAKKATTARKKAVGE